MDLILTISITCLLLGVLAGRKLKTIDDTNQYNTGYQEGYNRAVEKIRRVDGLVIRENDERYLN